MRQSQQALGTSPEQEQVLGRVVLVEGVGAVEEALQLDPVADPEAAGARGEGPESRRDRYTCAEDAEKAARDKRRSISVYA